MNEEIRDLEPKVLWNKFADLNAVPRPSKKEERVIEFIKNFGNNLNLKTKVDSVGNVVIYKAAVIARISSFCDLRSMIFSTEATF